MKRFLILLFALLAVSYALTPGLASLFDGSDFLVWRRQAVLLTGYAGLLFMAGAIVLATRPVWLEPWLGGLDKTYALHKWLGIAAGIALSLHWLAEKSARWMVEGGWLIAPAGHGRHGHGQGFGWMGLAKELGEWAFYLLLILVIIALAKKIPYRFFHLLHKALAVVFLAGAYHAAMFTPGPWYAGPAGWLIVVSVVAGIIAAGLSLTGRIGASRTTKGRIEEVSVGAGGVVDLRLALPEPGLRYQAGQFVFLCFDPAEGAHPFTLASADDPCHPRFAIKPLGDYTRTLAQRLIPGQEVRVEGPYGCFDFSAVGEREIWIAGGIGVTPFLARLDALIAEGGSRRQVDFWYCTTTATEAAFPADLDARCASAGVRLHRLVAARDGLLSAAGVAREVGKIAGSRVWFCGPEGFARSLRAGLEAAGLGRGAFHCERFAMR